jgi:hypothetical protein
MKSVVVSVLSIAIGSFFESMFIYTAIEDLFYQLIFVLKPLKQSNSE